MPLVQLPIIRVPFKWVQMDLVGLLPKSAQGHEYILVLVDYATSYPRSSSSSEDQVYEHRPQAGALV